MLLGLISTFVFRAVRDALPHDPIAQERILGASFTALALADVCNLIPSLLHNNTKLPLAYPRCSDKDSNAHAN